MIRHVAGIAEIVEDVEAAVGFYRDILGLPVKYEEDSPYAHVEVPGVLHFGLWSRIHAAEVTLGDASQADRIPLGFTVGLEVESVGEASGEMKTKGWPIAQTRREEPWGQVTSRFFSPSGALCEFSETPWARRITRPVEVESKEQ